MDHILQYLWVKTITAWNKWELNRNICKYIQEI